VDVDRGRGSKEPAILSKSADMDHPGTPPLHHAASGLRAISGRRWISIDHACVHLVHRTVTSEILITSNDAVPCAHRGQVMGRLRAGISRMCGTAAPKRKAQ
jgi:hypothetical protein